MGLQLNARTLQYMEQLGALRIVDLPKDEEGKVVSDKEPGLVAAVAGRDKLHIILGEVQCKTFNPLKAEKQKVEQKILKAFEQLEKDALFSQVDV